MLRLTRAAVGLSAVALAAIVACTSGPLAPTCPRSNYCQCKGTDDCEMDCGAICVVSCPQVRGSCTAKVGDGSTVNCDGTRKCDITCRGACSVSCNQGGACLLHCADPKTCVLQCDDPLGAVTCPDGTRKTCRIGC